MAKNRINIAIGANLKQFSSDMQNVKREMRKTSRKMKSLGQSMTRSLTVPLSLIGVASVKLAADFEQSMAKVRAVSGATGDEFKALNDNALELGRTTRYTAQQVAELQLNLSKLGFKPKEITQSTEAILNLALASGEDLAQSATVAANTMRGFGIATEESGRVADVMAKAFSSSGLDLEKFSVSMSKIAPIARAAGFGFEQTVSMMSALADAGVEASTIGTSLRQIFIELSTQGISFGDAMEQIRNSTNKAATATDLFDKRAAAAAIILAENETKLSDLSTAYLNAEGSAKAMAKTMDNTLMGAFLRLKSALEGAAIEIGKSLQPLVASLTDKITKLADRFSKLSPETKSIITKFGLFAAALGPVIVGLGMFIGLVFKSIGTIKAFAASAAFLLSPLGMLVGVLTLVALRFKRINDIKQNAARVNKELYSTINAENALRKRTHELAFREAYNVKSLLAVARDETRTKTERLEAIKKLNSINPQYINGITLENVETKRTTDQVENYIKKIKEKAKAQAASELLQKEFQKQIENEIAIQKKQEEQLAKVAERQKEVNELDESYGRQGDIDKKYIAEFEQPDVKATSDEFQKQINLLKEKGERISQNIELLAKEGGVLKNTTTDIQTPPDPTLDPTEEENEKRLKDNQKYLAELSKQRIENITNEKRQALELAAWNSEQRIKEIQNSLADEKIKNDLINEETKRADAERISIIQDFNTKAKKELFDNELKSLEAFNKEKSTHLIESLNENQITEQTFQQQSLQNDLEFLKLKLELYKKFGKDLTDLQLDLAKKQQDIQDQTATGTADAWESTFKSMEMSAENFITDTLGGFLDAIGQEMAGSTKAIDRFGENIIASFGKFISQFGQMLMAYGVAKTVLFKGGPMSGPEAIAAGAALVVLGGALKQMSSRASEAADGGYGNYGVGDTFAPTSTMGGSSMYGTSNDVMTLETVVYGRDIVLSSNRQHGTISRTRRK